MSHTNLYPQERANSSVLTGARHMISASSPSTLDRSMALLTSTQRTGRPHPDPN